MSHFLVVKAPFLLVKSQSQTTIMNYIVYIPNNPKLWRSTLQNLVVTYIITYIYIIIYIVYIYIYQYIYIYIDIMYMIWYTVYSIFSHLSASPTTPWAQLLGLDSAASALAACAPPRAARRRRELLAISFSRSCQPTRTSRFRGNFDLGICWFFWGF